MGYRLLYILFFFFLPFFAMAKGLSAVSSGGEEQEEYVLSQQDIEQISSDINMYISSLQNLTAMISGAKKTANIKGLESSLMSINVRWTTYYQLEQQDISISETLTQMYINYQQAYQTASDSIAKQKAIVDANENFTVAERFINNAQGQYDGFLSDAKKWSMTSKTAKQLEQIKVREQLFFQDVNKSYQDAVAAAKLDPTLATRMADLENVFIAVKANSETVQATVYLPLLIRIKDYVLSIAGVAVILLFLTMLQSKVAAVKAAAKAAKAMKKQMERNSGEIPEI